MTHELPLILILLGLTDVCICSENGGGAEIIGSQEKPRHYIFSKLMRTFSRERTSRDPFEDTNDLFKKGQYGQALIRLTEAINENPFEPSYYRHRALCYLKLDVPLMALSDFKKAISVAKESGKKDPLSSYDAELAALGKLFYMSVHRWRNFNEAVWCFGEAIKRNPTVASYYEGRGLYYLSLNRESDLFMETEFANKIDLDESDVLDQAISDFRMVLNINPDNKLARQNLVSLLLDGENIDEAMQEASFLEHEELTGMGNMYKKKKDFDIAARFYSEAIKQSPESPLNYEMRGACYLEMKRIDEAIADFRQQLQLTPFDIGAWFLLIKTLSSYKMEDEIKKVIKEMISALQEDDVLITKVADDLFEEDKSSKIALQLYDEASRINPSESKYYSRRAFFHFMKKDWDVTIQLLKNSLRSNPNNREDRIRLGEALFKVEQYDEAIKEMIMSRNDRALESLADDLSSMNKCEISIPCYTNLINKNDRDIFAKSIYYEKRGICYKQLKNYEEAILDLQMALRKTRGEAGIFVVTCDVLIELGKYKEALSVIVNLETKHYRKLTDPIIARISAARERIITAEAKTRSQK